ncbi:MAG: hypothetical protein EOP45_18770 [Sphingobacteriaceae bacterium]|nr:MAG: hypothetical protein EOP45_18770 [Sphingobacteriaceae bacterium]
MKTFQTFVGIDISKLSLDVSVIHWKEPNKATHYKVGNDGKGISKLLGQLSKSGTIIQDTLFVYENTGIYTTPLMTVLSNQELHYWVVAAIEIKIYHPVQRFAGGLHFCGPCKCFFYGHP